MDTWLPWLRRNNALVLAMVVLMGSLSSKAAVIMAKEEQQLFSEGNGLDSPIQQNPEQLELTNGILINEPYICEEKPFVVIFVHSHPAHAQLRTVIRGSWGSVAMDTTYKTRVIFLLGVDQNAETSTEIRRESTSFHDILQFNIVDAYKNLSLKSLAMLQWVEKFCARVKYVVKADDDTFINTPLLIGDLHSVVHTHFFMGDIIAGARPIRERQSKYFTTLQQYRDAMYPTYLSGAAYVISGDLISELTEAAKSVELFWLEDIYVTGLLARHTSAQHIFNGKFGFRIQNIAKCQFNRIVALHRISPVEMANAWTLLHRENTECS